MALNDLKEVKTNLIRLGKLEGEAGLFEDHRANIEGAPDEHPVKYMWWQNYGWTSVAGNWIPGRFWLQKAVEANKKQWINAYTEYTRAIREGSPWNADFMKHLMQTVTVDIKDQIAEDDVIDTTEGYESVTYKIKKG